MRRVLKFLLFFLGGLVSSPVLEPLFERLRNLYASTPPKPATSTTLGGIKLHGDLGGTADDPRVPGLSGKADLGADGKVRADQLPPSGGGGASSWDELTGKPTTFPPSTHSHPWSEVTSKPTVFPPETHSHGWDQVSGKPTVFPPAAHEHSIGEVSGLQDALDGKAPVEIEYESSSGPAVTDLPTLAYMADVARDRQKYIVRGGDGPPPEWLQVRDGDVWVDFTSGKHYEFEEELS